MNLGPRILRGPLLPGLTSGQQNRLALLLAVRSSVATSRLWEVYSAADKHAVEALALVAPENPLEDCAGDVAREHGITSIAAGLVLGLAIGLRLGIQWGHGNAVKNRARFNAQAKAKAEAEPPPTPTPPEDDLAAAKRWKKLAYALKPR